MLKIAIIGFGNVGRALAQAVHASQELELVQIYNRSAIAPENYPNITTNDLSALKPADLYLISVSDRSVAEVAGALPFENRLVAHTAGSLPPQVAGTRNRNGVFYPLQTFSKNRPIDFSTVPICIEAPLDRDLKTLEICARALSNQVHFIGTDARKMLHLSAVFACNFTNHLYAIADDLCKQHGLAFSLLEPLILETALKVRQIPAASAQTGPAIRGDKKVMDAHLELLANDTHKQIYTLLSGAIQEHGKKL